MIQVKSLDGGQKGGFLSILFTIHEKTLQGPKKSSVEAGVELWASSAKQEWGLRAWSEACCWESIIPEERPACWEDRISRRTVVSSQCSAGHWGPPKQERVERSAPSFPREHSEKAKQRGLLQKG